MDKSINFNENLKGAWYVLDIMGRLDTVTASIGEEKIKHTLDEHLKVALNLSDLDYISSAGLRVLLRIAKIAYKEKKEVVICGAHGMVQEILDDFDIEGFYTVYQSVADLA
ncbi:MAG: STAS domain-containing protein [Selenomonadaceae bacterium]|nr:STAS domain-containing protein [Selenomonadaceae bacterium]